MRVAPGIFLHPFDLERDVVSCEQAASAKGIPLANELKTLILETSVGTCAVELKGDETLHLRSVKRILNCGEARIASSQLLESLGLRRGAISAVLDPVWSLPHIVSENLFMLEFVSTNNGTHNQYFKFRPISLLYARAVIVDAIARSTMV